MLEIESAVALTERKRLGGLRSPVFGFHRESDWATQTAPEVAAELHRCERAPGAGEFSADRPGSALSAPAHPSISAAGWDAAAAAGKLTAMPLSALKEMGADVEGALDHVNVPSYVIDHAGVVRWMNEAARRLVGDQVGRQFTSVVHPEETRRARELFARKLLGNTDVTDAFFRVVDTEGNHLGVEISSVPLRQEEHVIGVFGQVSDVVEEPHAHPELHLTPRQAEILQLLERGRSTAQIADELHLSRETVRNHVKRLLHAVGASSRLEAVAVARGELVAAARG